MRKRHASRREKGGQVSGKRQGRNRRAHEGASRETPGIFIVLSGFATSDLSVDFVMLVRGAEPMETPAARPFVVLCLFAHMFFPALSPDSVDNRITAFE